MKKVYGLIGKKLSHSFSKDYFSKKFQQEGLQDHEYLLFELEEISELHNLLSKIPIHGLNVTIPYKQQVIEYLTDLDEEARNIGAVNTLKITNDYIKGFNTDVFGFDKSLAETIANKDITGALILGSGGASKAVQHVLHKKNINYEVVGRSLTLDYNKINQNLKYISDNNLIINTTPLGMYPEINAKPLLPYDQITPNHILFDLVYNPEITTFLNEGALRGATIKNGLDMLRYQADRAWEIWNDDTI